MRVMAKLKTVIELDYLLANTKKKKSVNGRYMNTPPQKKKRKEKKGLWESIMYYLFPAHFIC